MLVEIRKKFAETVGVEKFEQFGLNRNEWYRSNYSRTFTLEQLSAAKIKALFVLLNGHTKAKGIKEIIENIKFWQEAQLHPQAQEDKVALNCQQFSVLLKNYLALTDGHRIYRHEPDYHDGVWLAYYVNKIWYHPRRVEGSGKNKYVIAPSVSMTLLFQKYETIQSTSVTFEERECENTAHKALQLLGWYAELKRFRKKYLDETARYNDTVGNIGRQLWAVGYGSDNVDGNPSNRGDDWYWNQSKLIPLTWNDGPAKVVSDVLNEEDNEKSGRRSRESDNTVDVEFWKTAVAYCEEEPENANAVDEDEDEVESAEDEVESAEDEGVGDGGDDAVKEWGELDTQERHAKIEVPLHPLLVVFDLHKHLRLKVHVNQLTNYVYDKQIAEKLVLPGDLKHLVGLLVASKGGQFDDIVQGKSGGAIVLLAGKPGTGKTLTAEVFAESEERPLYSVQCSQLGTSSETIEGSLMKVFARAKRWNAVTLLDEADVYIHERGNDLEQNAIVGVFLRVLEYQAAVLFLTTNRPDDVDDAIASRCIAKLVYGAPDEIEQGRIWKVLAAGAGIKLTKDVKQIAKNNPKLTGRDVKNLLKLGRLMVGAKGEVTAEVIERVKKFKPTT